MNSVNPTLLSLQEINQRFDLSPYDIIGNYSYDGILLFDGDATINGDLNKDQVKAILQELQEEKSLSSLLVMVNGNLIVNGQIGMGDYSPHVLVLGNVHCDVLYSSDDTMYISGNAYVKYAYYGYYNDGCIFVDGITYVPYVLNSDHHSAITPQNAILINIFSDQDDFFEYDYTSETLPQVVVPAALDDKGEFDAWKFIEIVKSGQSPFNEGVKTLRLVYEEELERITSGYIEEVTELDWSDKKLKTFPASLTKLKKLKMLNLSNNNIAHIPEIIGELTNLEALYLADCNIETIHEAIGNLKKLQVLDLSANHHLSAFPAALGELSELQVLELNYVATPLPASLGKLEKLEEISMYKCYSNAENAALFPEVITKLTNLKRFDFRENIIKELPESLENIQTLESFLWTGGRTQSAVGPDFTRFSKLIKLAIGKKFYGWKDVVFNITTLEHLELDRNKEERQTFNQLTLDIWVKSAAEKNDEAFKKRVQWIQENKIAESERWFYVVNKPGIQPGELADINKLQNLKYLDLSFNDLTSLPETFYELKNLEYLDLQNNKFPADVKERITQAFPAAQVIL